MKTCTYGDCNIKAKAKGLCDKHYLRSRAYGGVVGGQDKPKYESLEARFLNYVHKTDECWLWIGKSFTEFGYGRFNAGNKKISHAHRVSYELFVKKIPKGLFVLHKCDNPKCVNPEHLFLGDAKDNADDMIAKGRNNPSTKYSVETVGRIREDAANGMTIKELNNKHGMSVRHLRDVLNNKWRKNEKQKS